MRNKVSVYSFSYLQDTLEASSNHLSHSQSLIPVVSQFYDITEHLSCQFTVA